MTTMRRVMHAIVTFAVALAMTTSLVACDLEGYPSGTVSCVVGRDETACPDGYVCVDPQRTGQTTCVLQGCGDGEVQGGTETCDDANANDDDLCDRTCRRARFSAVPVVGFGRTGGDPVETSIGHPFLVASDFDANLHVLSLGTNLLTRFDARADRITRFAGNGSSIDVTARLRSARPDEFSTAVSVSLAVDAIGNVFLADVRANVIRRIDAVTGRMDVIAGSDVAQGRALDGEVATASPIQQPISVAVDGDGRAFFVENAAGPDETTRVFFVDPDTGRLARVPGGAPPSQFDDAQDIDFDALGNLWMITRNEASLLLQRPDGSRREARLPDCDGDPTTPVVSRDQAKLAVTRDGSMVFWPNGVEVYGVATDALFAGSSRCAVVARVPEKVATNPIFTAGIGDLTIVPRADVDDNASDVVAATDPGNGVVWLFPVDQSAAPFEPRECLEVIAADVDNDDARGVARRVLGSCFTEDEDGLVREAIRGFAAEADGRIALTESAQCLQAAITSLDRYDLFLPLPASHIVVRVTCNRSISVVAGTGVRGFSANTGDPLDDDRPRPAARASLDTPVGAGSTRNGDIFIADRGNDRIRRVFVAPSGVAGCTPGELCIETLVPPCLSSSTPQPCVVRPSGLSIDAAGQLLISDTGPVDGAGRLLRVDPVTRAFTVMERDLLEPAGSAFIGYAALGELAQVPVSCAPDESCGVLFLAERGAHRIHALALAPFAGLVQPRILAGAVDDADQPLAGDDDDGDGKRGALRFPRGVMLELLSGVPGVDGAATSSPQAGLLVVDAIDRQRSIALSPTFGLAGLSLQPTLATVSARARDGRGAPARDDAADGGAFLRAPVAVLALDDGRVLLADQVTGRLRLVTPSDPVDVVTVTGLPGGVELTLDDAPAPVSDAAPLDEPHSMARVGDDVFVTEPRRGTIRRFRLTDPAQPSTWTTDVFIDVDDLALPEGTLREPTGITADAERNVLYVSDRRTHVVVALNIDTDTHDPRVVAGQAGRRGFAGDDEPAPGTCVAAQVRSATSALLNAPEGVLFLRSPVDDNSYLYVADTGNNRVRRVARSDNDRITTVLGDGSFGSGGDGPDARSFPVAAPRGLATDDSGNLFVTSGNAVRIVQSDTFVDRCSQQGVVDGFDRVDSIYGRAPRANFPEPVTRCLSALALDPRSTTGATALWAVDSCVGLLLRLEHTLADAGSAP